MPPRSKTSKAKCRQGCLRVGLSRSGAPSTMTPQAGEPLSGETTGNFLLRVEGKIPSRKNPTLRTSTATGFPLEYIYKMLVVSGVHSCDLSVVFLSGAQMRKLNRTSLGHDYVTDVITFDLREEGRGEREVGSGIEGEIYICPAEARRNARLYGEPYDRELLRYIAHGILHLLGYDDATPRLRDRMRREEDRLLRGCLRVEASRSGAPSTMTP
ncbi:MAG: rRNA maturation RNase YbeY [Candidatus Omnitrophica bacterium]|nr:rRNA maturation RNase YbeY [Candidatus Omnitrophota bacterium]